MSNQTVTRADLADTLHQEVGLSHHECKKLVDDVLNEIADGLDSEDKMTISNFGSFTIRHKDERMGRNPKTGAQITIPAAWVVKVAVGKLLKEQVNID